VHAVRFTHGLTIIIHKESFDILSLWAGELDVASVTSLAVYFLDTPGLVNVSEGTSRNRILKTWFAIQVVPLCGVSLSTYD
jgi:hypothetical protein